MRFRAAFWGADSPIRGTERSSIGLARRRGSRWRRRKPQDAYSSLATELDVEASEFDVEASEVDVEALEVDVEASSSLLMVGAICGVTIGMPSLGRAS